MNKDFEKLIETLKDDSFLIIKNWHTFSLKDIKDNKANCDKSGIYAIGSEKYGIIYIGKAKSIYERLKSHFNATEGKENAPAWKQFFDHKELKFELKAYYFETSNYSIENKECINQILERVSQLIEKPLFDKMYSVKGHKSITNEEFDQKLSTLQNVIIRD
ncbi:MAG: GIY-YIG nuclease family protein [Bacteroidota bacterium]